MFNCDTIYQATIKIQNTSLLVLNITLPNTVHEMSKNFVLDKFPIFCDRKYPKCANNDLNVIKAKYLPVFGEQKNGSINTKSSTVFSQLFIILFSTILFY